MLQLFKKNKPQSLPDNAFKTLSAEALLHEDIYAKQIIQLKELLSVTKEIYQDFYLEPLCHLAARIQHLPAFEKGPYHIRGGFLKLILQRTIIALKYRRSLMLPVGAAPEEQYREHDLWTYAIYTASLFRDCWLLYTAFDVNMSTTHNQAESWCPLAGPMPMSSSYQFKMAAFIDDRLCPGLNALIVMQLLNPKAMAWLYKVPHIFSDWLIYISHSPHSSTVGKVVEQAHTLVSPNEPAQSNNQQTNLQVNDTAVANIIEADPVAKLNNSLQAKSETLSEIFICWLKQSLNNSQYPFNQNESFVFRTEEGLLVRMPNAAEAFYKENNNLSSFSESVTVEQVITELSRAEYVIQHSDSNQKFHRYYLGEWKNRHVLEGILIQPEALSLGTGVPPIHPDCHLEI